MVSPPPGVDSASRVPPCASVSPRATASPSPTPVPASPCRWNGSKIRARSAGGDARDRGRRPGARPAPRGSRRSTSTVVAVAQSVRDQVGHDALEQTGVDVRRGELADLDPLGPLEPVQRHGVRPHRAGPRRRSADGAGLQAAHVEQVADHRGQPGDRTSPSPSRSSCRSAAPSRRVVDAQASRPPSGARRAASAGRGRPRRAAPCGCGCRPRAAGRPCSAGPAPRARAGRRRGRRRPRRPSVRGGRARAAQHQPAAGAGRHDDRAGAARGSSVTSSADVRPEGVAGQGQQPRDVVLAAQDLAVEHGERAGLVLRGARLLAPAGGGVDDGGDRDGGDHEDHQRVRRRCWTRRRGCAGAG